jgi:hypothetical protein
MNRRTILWVLAALMGIVATATVAWSASQLATQRIGLSSEPLSVAGGLAPAGPKPLTRWHRPSHPAEHRAKPDPTIPAHAATPPPSTTSPSTTIPQPPPASIPAATPTPPPSTTTHSAATTHNRRDDSGGASDHSAGQRDD